MSPTSYQAAPPRTTTIAEPPTPVKFPPCLQAALPNSASSIIPLPRRIRSSVAPRLFAARMHVVNARARLIRAQHRISDMRDPIFLMAHRVDGHLAQVVRFYQ